MYLSYTHATGNREPYVVASPCIFFLPVGRLSSWITPEMAGCQCGHHGGLCGCSHVQAASSAPWLLPRAALAVVMVGVAGPSACLASDAPFLGPCSCAWGQQPPLSPLSPRCLLPALSLPCPLQKESNSSLSIQPSCSFFPTKQNAPFLLFVGMPPPGR